MIKAVVRVIILYIINSQQYMLRKLVLNIEDETSTKSISKWLNMGNELCGGTGRMIPMSTDLTLKVRDIYQKCKSEMGELPLIMALDMGLMDMVWGFIECAKQTNTNLHTLIKGDEYVREFFWLSNKQNETAFEFAIRKNHMEVARLLLENAPSNCLRSQLNLRKKAVINDLLNDPKNDKSIFDWLEDEKRSESISTSISVNSPRELIIRINGIKRTVTPEDFEKIGNSLDGQDASNNTVLHLASKMGNEACIQYILDKYPPEQWPQILDSRNSDMETPAYVAAREGRVDVLRFLLLKLNQVTEDIEPIVTRDIDQQNALHIAIQNHHVEVIFLLMDKIPQLASRINKSSESPLYMAAERGYFAVVELMLRKYSSSRIALSGPNRKTALHAAAISDSADCLEYLLNEYSDRVNVQDERGWTPFQHAVYHNSLLAATKLLDVDNNIGYKFFHQNGIYTSAIHIAASRGHCEIMKLLMDTCPGCSEFIDNKGRNILHVAVENKKNKAIEFIFRDESLTNLINQKDKNGNTPVHLLAASDFEQLEMLMDSRVNINVLNNEQLTPLEYMVSSRNENFIETLSPSDDRRERFIKSMTTRTRKHGKTTSALSPEINNKRMTEMEREAFGKKKDTHFTIVDDLVVVAALIATASFAAALSVPGGFDSSNGSNQGTPFLLKKQAFQTFVVTNAIAFSCSCYTLLGHVALLLHRNRLNEASLDELEYVHLKIEGMYYLSTVAMIAFSIAFATGVYVVLTPSLGLAISVCVMSLLFSVFGMQGENLFKDAADIRLY